MEEGLGNGDLPTISAQGRGVWDDSNQGKFIVYWILGQQQAGSNLARDTHVGLPDLASIRLWHGPQTNVIQTATD